MRRNNRYERAYDAFQGNPALVDDHHELSRVINCSLQRAKDCRDAYRSMKVYQLSLNGAHFHNDWDWWCDVFAMIGDNPTITDEQLTERLGYSYPQKAYWGRLAFSAYYKVSVLGETRVD